MKFVNSVGPNPRCVRMFMAEKGITLDTIDVDLLSGEQKAALHRQESWWSNAVPGTR